VTVICECQLLLTDVDVIIFHCWCDHTKKTKKGRLKLELLTCKYLYLLYSADMGWLKEETCYWIGIF